MKRGFFPSRRLRRAIGIFLVTVPVAAMRAQPTPASAVVPWPGVTIPNGTIAELSEQGIVVRPNDPAEPLHLFGWHEIRSVRGLPDERREDLEIGRRLWHSRLRLDRGDWTSAEALLEPLEPAMRGARGPTAAAYYRALLRVRLARMDRPAATIAWLGLLAADDDTPVNAELGPFYLGPTQATLSGKADTEEPEQDWRVHAIALAWASAEPSARPATQPEVDALLANAPSTLTDSRLQTLCLAAYAGSSETRDSALRELAPLSQTDETYRGTWARYAAARSQTLEADPGRVRLGIAGLLEVSLRDERTAPLLAGLALAEAANAASRINDPNAARVLATEFRRRFPGHPAQRTIPEALSPHTDTSETTP